VLDAVTDEIMKPIYLCRLILVSAACGFISPLAHGQASLSKTTLGKSQNDERDLANSLVPGKQRFGKGEKKEEVDPQKLPTKAIKDPRFQGSLLDEGLDSSAETKSQDEKGVGGSEKDSKVSKQAATSGDKDSKVSKSTQTGDGQNKDQKATSAKSDEKAPEKEKASASKTDGHH
jgi:hypothetical protein